MSPEQDPIHVLLVDDHQIVRDGLHALLDARPEFHVVGSTDDSQEMLDQLRSQRVDVLIVDLEMPGRAGGLDILRQVAASGLETRTLVLTAHEDLSHFQQALAAGASGYVTKRLAAEQLLDAIRAVHGGRTHFSVSLTGRPAGDAAQGDAMAGWQLSAREREVLIFVADGYTNREVAEKLHLSVKTVEGYRARVTRKLGARNRRDLVQHARRLGLID